MTPLMKSLLLSLGLITVSTSLLLAQSRVSIAPTYWYSYATYSYQVRSTSGSEGPFTGHSAGSSVGLTARYHFNPKWDMSVGLLYNWDSIIWDSSLSSLNLPKITTEAIQLPVLVNYRLTARRLSPYFSAGAFLYKSKTPKEPIKVNGILGVGLDYRLNSGLSLLIQPKASYLFFRPAKDALPEITNFVSYNLGIQAQLIWHF